MTTEERLNILERELSDTKRGLTDAKRRNHWLLVVVGLAVVGAGLAWMWNKTTPAAQAQGQATNPAKKVIRANEFILEDAEGKTRAMLVVDKDGPALRLLDEKDEVRASLVVDKDGSRLGLYDEKGEVRAGLNALKDGSLLDMYDEKGKGRAILDVGKDGPRLRLADEKGKVWSAPSQ